ncbi:MAG: caspase family protein [Prevotella sp.]|nr:caspase family protein [Prevotella sp.]
MNLRYVSLFLLLACSVVLQAKSYVVCVGISDYPGTQNDLTLPVSDAKTIKGIFESNGDAKVEIVLDEQATRQHVIATMNDLYRNATAGDAIVFFYAGHGAPTGFVCYDGLLRYDEVSQVMASYNVKRKMVWADSCFSGKARKKISKPMAVTAQQDVLFFLASRSDETSKEFRGWRNGLFTAYLERGLRGGADANLDRTITARELFDFVSQGVANTSRKKQHPVMWGHFDDGMPVMVW